MKKIQQKFYSGFMKILYTYVCIFEESELFRKFIRRISYFAKVGWHFYDSYLYSKDPKTRQKRIASRIFHTKATRRISLLVGIALIFYGHASVHTKLCI